MLTPQTDSVNCLALVLCQSIIVKCIFLFYLLLVFLLPYRIYGEKIKLCKRTDVFERVCPHLVVQTAAYWLNSERPVMNTWQVRGQRHS